MAQTPGVFDPKGGYWTHGANQAASLLTTAATGTYSGTEQTVINNCKTVCNALLAIAKSRGFMAVD